MSFVGGYKERKLEVLTYMKCDISHPIPTNQTLGKIFQSNYLFIPPTKTYPKRKGTSNIVEALDEE
jgi:hypothetical protein